MQGKLKFISSYDIEGVEKATLKECIDYISSIKIVGLDIETSRKFPKGVYNEDVYKGGLDPYLSCVVMIQIGDINCQYVIDVRDFSKEEIQSILKPIYYNPEKIVVGHNLKFEAKHLKYNYGLELHTVYDTLIGEITLYNGLSLSLGLADLAFRYLEIKKKEEKVLFPLPKKAVVTMDDRLIEENANAITPFDLEDFSEIDKSTRLQFINIGSKPFTYTQVAYGRDDIIFPILIRERQLVGRVLPDKVVHNPTTWQKNENHYLLVLADLELNGMNVDRKMWEDLHDKNYLVYQERERKLTTWVLANFPQYAAGTLDLFSNAPRCNIKWTSSDQVVKFFVSQNKCPKAYSKQTRSVEYTVGATELIRVLPNSLKVLYEKNKDADIVDWDTFVLAYLLFKKSEQAVTTFGKKWLKYLHPITGRAHSSYRQILNTTRISSTNPNLNNISGGDWRDCFKVPKGKKMVNLDFSAQEVRQLAVVSKDPALMNFFIQGDAYFGEDFHSFTATKVYKILEDNPELLVPPKEIKDENGNFIKHPDFTSEDNNRRSNSKQVTFGLAFGKSSFTFSKDLGIPEEEAEDLINSYLDAFPELKTLFAECERKAKTKSYITIDEFTKARWFCPFFDEIKYLRDEANKYFPEDYRELSYQDKVSARQQVYKEHPFVKDLFRQAGRLESGYINKNKNYIIQGACSQMFKMAMNIFRKKRIEGNLNYKLIGNIYDEVLIEVDEKDAEDCGKLMKECMETGGKIISPTVPQVANYVIADSWGH